MSIEQIHVQITFKNAKKFKFLHCKAFSLMIIAKNILVNHPIHIMFLIKIILAFSSLHKNDKIQIGMSMAHVKITHKNAKYIHFIRKIRVRHYYIMEKYRQILQRIVMKASCKMKRILFFFLIGEQYGNSGGETLVYNLKYQLKFLPI